MIVCAIELASFSSSKSDTTKNEEEDDLALLIPKNNPMPLPRDPSGGVDATFCGYQHCGTSRVRNALLAAIGAIVVVLKSSRTEPAAPIPGVGGVEPSISSMDNVVTYTCPGNVKTSLNDKHDDFKSYLEDDEKHRNKTLADFRSMKMDGWGISYEVVKAMLRPWKEEAFVPNGMNLLLTTEILKEHSIHNVTIYGNDYVSESVFIANRIWAAEEASRIAKKGRLCHGDSSNLDFVPSASFDFVYTGYIDPLTDPLNIHDMNLTAEGKWELDVRLCKSSRPDDKALVKRAQLVQEEWFNSWVVELIRIAKPGRVIAIENGAEAICTNRLDWGGVDKSWWSAETASKYGWDIDPGSIVIRDEKGVGAWVDIRYHILMRKNAVN